MSVHGAQAQGPGIREIAQQVHRERQERASGVVLARRDVTAIDRMLREATGGSENGRLQIRARVARRRLVLALGREALPAGNEMETFLGRLDAWLTRDTAMTHQALDRLIGALEPPNRSRR